MKEFLEKLISAKEATASEIREKIEASADVNEVRSLGDTLQTVLNEIQDAKNQLSALETEERAKVRGDEKAAGFSPIAAYGAKPAEEAEKREDGSMDCFSTMEYRRAFMTYAQKGTPIPADLIQRDGSPANTVTLGATIPTTILNEFINEIQKRYGNLYSKVRKLNIPGAVKVPIAQLQAQFKWISEDTVSPRQDGGKISDYVEFSYNMAEIRVAQTLLSQIVSIDLFEREIVNVMLIAYLQAMDTGIVKGTGNGQMLGILNDPRVAATGNVVTLTAAEIGNWTAWRKKFFAHLPLGYRAGEFIFPIGTVDAYLETMADSNNNPIFRQATGLEVNDGDAANPNGRFFGREISLVEPDIIADFDSASSGDVIGIYWQPDQYAINTNMQFGLRRWFDEDRNEWVNKMLTVVDGKVLNPMGIWLIKKA